MKRLLYLLLTALMMLSMCACGSQNSNTTSQIMLTPQNSENYLKITPQATQVADFNGVQNTLLGANLSVDVIGASTNFNYHDVAIKLKVIVNFKKNGTLVGKCERDLELYLNISGGGSIEKEFLELSNPVKKTGVVTEITYEVIKVSGYVEPA